MFSLYGSGKCCNCFGQAMTVKKSLQRIRIQLDYDTGEVSFYDVDGMAHIYTYKDTITEKLFPYLHIGEPGSIKVCQTDISPIVRTIFVV